MSSGPGPSGGGTPREQRFIVVTPATTLSSETARSYIPSGTYTRLTIRSPDVGGTGDFDEEIYPYRTRDAIERFFVGTHHSAVLSIKVTSGAFVGTVPLLSLNHESTRSEGESFNRIVRHSAMDFPMFLVRGNTTSDIASATIDLKGSDGITSSVATSALSAVLDAAKVLGAPPSLVTTLSAGSNKELATTIDATISKLFAKSIEEQQIVDQPIRTFQPVRITLQLPHREGGWDDRRTLGRHPTRADLDYVEIGTWVLDFQPPRVSAFSAVDMVCSAPGLASCNPAYPAAVAAARTDVRAHLNDVLTFPLIKDGSSMGTIAAYLRQQDWWTPGVKDLDAKGDPAHFCREIRDTVSALGFNALDGYLVVEAVKGSQLLTTKEVETLTAPDCTLPAAG